MNKDIASVDYAGFASTRTAVSRTLGGLALALLAACAPVREPPQQVQATTPTVSYSYSTDDGLVEANGKAQTYCAQYASTPVLHGSIIDNSDGTRTVTFQCVQSTPVATTLAPPASRYRYSADAEFVQALRTADQYCAQRGQRASTHIVANPDGTKTMTYECVPR